MAALQEVAVTSCLNDPVVSCYVWDVQTGTNLTTYRGDCAVTPAGLSLLSGEYVVAALQDKPFLRVWPVNSQQSLATLRLICPGRVTHAKVSPDNCYIAVTVAEKLHLYQIASGRLVGTGTRHFQSIRVLQWTSDGSLVVCGGEDGLVTVWTLTTLATSQSNPEPLHVLSNHSLPVTDLAVTAGLQPRLISVSADRTCKIYDLSQGTLLVSLVFNNILTAVTTSLLETDVFVGTDRGTILQFSLLSPPRNVEYHLTPEECAPVFMGHTKAVRSLSASFDGDVLMSGSTDGSVKIWHISSRQCLRTLTHKGPITNAFFALKPKQMFEIELKPSVIINAFKTANREGDNCVEVITEKSMSLCDYSSRDLFPPVQESSSCEGRMKALQTEIDLLRSINSNLYKFSVDKIIEGNSVVPLVSKVVQVPVKVKKGKKKVKGKLVNKSVNNNKTNVVSVNGVSNIKKRKRKRNKKKINKTN